MARRKKGKTVRKRSKKTLSRKRKRSKKYKASKWKLNYPDFKEISYYPYIVKKDEFKEF